MLCREVQNYISNATKLPFFYAVGDDYKSVLDELKQSGISVVRMSDCCLNNDRFPSIDTLLDDLKNGEDDEKYVVVGLGEFLALKGSDYTFKQLERLKYKAIGNKKIILLLRDISNHVTELIKRDPRISDQKRAFVSESTGSYVTITKVEENSGLSELRGFKELLRKLEDGTEENIFVSTVLSFEDSMLTVRTLNSVHAVISQISENFDLPENIGTAEQWSCLYKDIKGCKKGLVGVYENYGISEDIYDDLYNKISGFKYENWLTFLYLKQNEIYQKNTYLKLVIHETDNYENLKDNLLIKITEFSHTDPNFRSLYDDRKKLLKDYQEEDIITFINVNNENSDESIYRYTDNTLAEKKEVVKWVTDHGITDALTYVYPALDIYLRKYTFNCPVLSEELTEYFDEYDKLKVTNKITDDFIRLVDKYAEDYSYAKLPTRDNVIQSVKDKEHSHLYWVDALGVEYLSYISELTERKGLSMHVDIVRCDLPTITAENKSFFDQWEGDKFSDKRLDEIKHSDANEYPIHIPEELDVIESVINIASLKLASNKCKSFIIASDHGASRLAVIKKQDELIETETKGEHSGRCCKYFEGCNIPHTIEENGYIILSDYGRFKGSRLSSVEVHGGASLEEVVVPIITLTLKKANEPTIKLINPDNIMADRHDGVTLSLYISEVDSPNDVRILVDGKSYGGYSNDGMHFTFNLKEIKRAKKGLYNAEVKDGTDIIGRISFEVKSKTAVIKDDFDDLF